MSTNGQNSVCEKHMVLLMELEIETKRECVGQGVGN
jgi:hypothetical protein